MQKSHMMPVATYPAIVGGVLSDLRKRANLRQEDVAKAIGVAQTTWSRIETGQSSATVEHLKLAAEHLGYPPSDILYFADQAACHLKNQGVEIKITREEVDFKAVAIVSAVTLAAIVALLIASKSSN